jgi:hypothetical protein
VDLGLRDRVCVVTGSTEGIGLETARLLAEEGARVAGVVYAASMGGRTTAWHWRSGRPLWTFPHGRYVPVSGNGARLLLHGGGSIWAVEPKRKR